MSTFDPEDLAPPEGDPRRCHLHPWVKTSDPSGLFDAPCSACEALGDMAQYDEQEGSVSQAEIAEFCRVSGLYLSRGHEAFEAAYADLIARWGRRRVELVESEIEDRMAFDEETRTELP